MGRYGNAVRQPTSRGEAGLQGTTWSKGPFEATLYWRHLGSASIEPTQSADNDGDGAPDVFPEFQRIDSFDYFDLNASWSPTDYMTVRLSVANLLEEDPPVVGNEAADTRSNSGNTFPSVYDSVGSHLRAGCALPILRICLIRYSRRRASARRFFCLSPRLRWHTRFNSASFEVTYEARVKVLFVALCSPQRCSRR